MISDSSINLGWVLVGIIVVITAASIVMYLMSILTKVIVSAFYETKRRYDRLKRMENKNGEEDL